MGKVIPIDKSIIPACDVMLDVFEEIVEETADVEKVGAYKVGVSFLDIGLKIVVDTARKYTNKPIIYDHQKAGTDIHELVPDKFMDAMLKSRIDAVILFPEAGPVTQYEWTIAAQKRDLGVIVGGEMTHPRYLEDDLSEGKNKNYTQIFGDIGIEKNLTGYMRKFAPDDMYELATKMDVTDFVVPGNKPEKIKHYKTLIIDCGCSKPSFFSPGFVAQGGEISGGAKAAGKRFHGIIGRGIYQVDNKRQAAIELTGKL